MGLIFFWGLLCFIPVGISLKFRKEFMATTLLRFFTFALVAVCFACMNLGPLGVILGAPSILMSAAVCAYLTRSDK